MGIVSIDLDASEVVAGIVEAARIAVRQLKDGKRACSGEAPMHLLVGLHGHLRGLNDTWASFGVVQADAQGNLSLTSKGQAVEALIAEREGDPSYSLLAGYGEMHTAGADLCDLISATIGDEPAQYVRNVETNLYEINKPVLPEVATSIQAVIDLIEG